MINDELQFYIETVIPNIEYKMQEGEVEGAELVELYNLYVDLLRITAPVHFESYNKYLELDEDHNDKNKAFYFHRKEHLKELFDAFNDMEIYDKYDLLLVSLPPRTGKTTTGIRFLSWIIGKYGEETQLATSYSDSITTSFYIGVMEIVQSSRFKEVFPESILISQNAKREEIWLKVAKRYPSITFAPIGGSMTGRTEASRYIYFDDLVSGIEEALSIVRLESLWSKYTVNGKQRKKQGCKEIHIATRWSVHDPISRLTVDNEDNPRCKVINISCYDENEESQFDFMGGFNTAYYKELENTMDYPSFSALYLQQPIEREGLLYQKEELNYFFDLPEGVPDAIVSICDSKNLGKDYVSSPIGYVFGNDVFIPDVVYNNSLPEVTRVLVANKWLEHKVVRADVELNNGGNYYAEDLNKLIKEKGGHTSIRIFFSSNNKQVKIITYSDFVKKRFVFRDPSTYSPNSEYARFMKDTLSWTQTGKNKFDDAPDSLAMLAQLIQDLEGSSVKIMDRRKLGI